MHFWTVYTFLLLFQDEETDQKLEYTTTGGKPVETLARSPNMRQYAAIRHSEGQCSSLINNFYRHVCPFTASFWHHIV